MRRHMIVILVIMFLTSCIAMAAPQSVGEVKEGLTCLDYQPGLPWSQIAGMFGEPDIAPKPGPGDLSKNTRIYQGLTVIFHTKRLQIKQGDRLKSIEVIDQLEICKPK